MKKSFYRAWRSRRNGRSAYSESNGHTVTAPQDVVEPGLLSGRLWIILLLCLLGSAIGSFVIFKYIAPAMLAPSIPRELVGTWQVTEGPLQGATLEFTWYGTSSAIMANKEGKLETTSSSVRVVGDMIFLTSKDARTGIQETTTQAILELTEDQLVIRDEDRHVYQMVRIRN
jgi:hypothetical protein